MNRAYPTIIAAVLAVVVVNLVHGLLFAATSDLDLNTFGRLTDGPVAF